jgi:murein L,D-transpeptidase YafK
MTNRRGLAVLFLLFFACTSFFHRSYTAGGYYIIIDKSDYELNVYDKDGWLVAYPVVFGSSDQGDKQYQGDRRTPEGSFAIASKRPHEKWDRMMLLNYPTPADVAAFNERKKQGLMPARASLGGGIGIHGTWPHEDYAIDRYLNWTQGCISMKNEHVEQLYKIIAVGTSVTIRK